MSRQEKKKLLREKIKSAEQKLIQVRKEWLNEIKEETFLDLAQISSKSLEGEIRKHKFLSRFLCDSAEDGEYQAYYFDIALGSHLLKTSVHTNPLLGATMPSLSELETVWLERFAPYVKESVQEEKDKQALALVTPPKQKIYLYNFFHSLTETKDLDDTTWNRMKQCLKDDLLEDEDAYKTLLKLVLFVRFLFVITSVTENEQPFSSGLECHCVSHYISSENQWLFACVGYVPF